MARIEITPEEAAEITKLGSNQTMLAECAWQSEQALFTPGIPTAGYFGLVESEKAMLALDDKPGQYGTRKDVPDTLFLQLTSPSKEKKSWVTLGIRSA